MKHTKVIFLIEKPGGIVTPAYFPRFKIPFNTLKKML